jgi:type IV pilus assembly protein PilP
MTRHPLQRNSRLPAVAALVLVAAIVSGCSKKEQPPPAVPSPVPVKAKQQQVSSVQKPMSSVSVKLAPPPLVDQFDFSGKKDPFKPAIDTKVATAQLPGGLKKGLPGALPIHSFDVSQFKLIGVVTGAKENQAMVVDPNGKGYVLKKGMTIGKNDGRVTSIGINGVEVVEQFRDDTGRVRKETIKITLPRKQ